MRVPACLPPGRVWLPAGDLPAALRALEVLRAGQTAPGAGPQGQEGDSI